MTSSNSSLSEGRLGLYYLGMGLTAVGLILFLSVFVSAFRGASNPTGFSSQPPASIVWSEDGKGNVAPFPQEGPSVSDSGTPNFGNALAGMVLMIAGGA